MIISSNRNPSLSEFRSLVDIATAKLNDDAACRQEYFAKRNAQLLEEDVLAALKVSAEGSPFDGTIELVSGQRFPDIVAARYFGVEVKSSKDDKWLSLGGSINESTRVEGVGRIFLTYGKLVRPVEFRSRPYEDCLSDVVVTHYPRYKIDMNLPKDKTIFSKMDTTYDDLRLSPNPVGQIVDYYKSQLGEGESLWWAGKPTHEDGIEEAAFMKIRLFNTLEPHEKQRIKTMGYALFPDVLSNSSKKYGRFALWLTANHGVISTSTRDIFSAGGQGVVASKHTQFNNVPRSFMHIYENRNVIERIILNSEINVLEETWQVVGINKDRIAQWIDIVSCKSGNIHEDYDCKTLLFAIFNRS